MHQNFNLFSFVHLSQQDKFVSKNKKVVKTFELNQSMSRVDDPYDNAMA